MKRKSILALTVLSIYSGVLNYAKAQEEPTGPSMSLVDFLFKSPVIVGVGYSHASNNGIIAPWDITFKMKTYYNLDRESYFPARVSVEKDLFMFRQKKYAKGFSLQGIFSMHGFKPTLFAAADINLKYDLNTLIGDTKFFDPYLSAGFGLTKIHYEFWRYPTYKFLGNDLGGDYRPAIQHKWVKDRFLTLNAGVGANFWINDFIAINLDAAGKWHWLEKTARNRPKEGTNYTQYTLGVSFKIGGCSAAKEEVVEEKPVSNYKRSQEEEDALIHLREHLNE